MYIKDEVILDDLDEEPDYDEETYRKILATYDYIENTFKAQYSATLKKEKDLRLEILLQKIELPLYSKSNY